MQKMARRHNKEGGNHLEQESNRQKAMEDIDGRLHRAVDGQSLGEGEGDSVRVQGLQNEFSVTSYLVNGLEWV